MSVSASAENLSSDAQSCDDGSMCLELALEGERLCKAGDCQAGVTFFQEAIKAGTHDLRTLSAIYSQLGNAYFYLGDYNEAMKHHKYDLMLARKMNDALGEAKASGNLGNTLKVMGKFTEAIQCCERHLEISRSLGDTLSEGRALYNLGNVYHAQGKQLGRMGQNDPGHFPQEVRDCLHLAVKFYEYNLELMRSLNDRQAMGRACGNLGNTYYLLGDFNRAIQFHTERLHIAQEYNDKPAERRANSNLGNSHIFLGQFENAAEHYKRTLALAEELGDAAVEAQACYSLGNTYTLLREYRVAEEYHARHLAAARKLQDRVGEGRACWSLGNAHAALGNHEKALYYAKEHYNISKELGDMLGVATAQMNIGDLKKVLGLPTEQTLGPAPDQMNQVHLDQFSTLRVRRQSMEQLSLIQITPDKKDEPRNAEPAVEDPEESLQDIIARCQAGRLNEQRVALSVLKQEKENRPKPPAIKLNRSNSGGARHTGESMIELLIKQSDRIDSQRAELPARVETKEAEAPLPGLRDEKKPKPDDDLLDIIERVQGPRLDDQRTVLPRPKPKPEKAQTMPEDDFFSRLMRAQASRMEEQRATIPLKENRANKADSNAKK